MRLEMNMEEYWCKIVELDTGFKNNNMENVIFKMRVQNLEEVNKNLKIEAEQK